MSISGRSPGGGNGNLLQYSFWENPKDRGAWQATVCGVTELEVTEHTPTHPHTKTINHPGSKPGSRGFHLGSSGLDLTCVAGRATSKMFLWKRRGPSRHKRRSRWTSWGRRRSASKEDSQAFRMGSSNSNTEEILHTALREFPQILIKRHHLPGFELWCL